MQSIIRFLRELSLNNNREWFQAHKGEYLEVQARFNQLAEQLIEKVGAFDETVRGLSVKDCTYRIYRDTRFSHDKSPYKTHIGCFICRGGKKSGYSGYYFHVGTTEGDEYPSGHMLAAGNYCIEPKALQFLREDIVMGGGDFQAVVEMAHPSFRLDEEFRMKRPPKGYSDDSPYIDLLKYKVHCFTAPLTNEEMLQPDLIDRVAARFETTKPFIDYINRAIEYAKEGNE